MIRYSEGYKYQLEALYACETPVTGTLIEDDLFTLNESGLLVIRKGFRAGIDSYSAFFENDKTTATGLHGYLTERGITSVTLVGLATDFCVGFSALDAARLGYRVTLLEGACRAIDLDGSLARTRAQTEAAGVIWAA